MPGAQPPLVERERDLAALAAALRDALAGTGRVVVIQGPPGIGKTRLLESVLADARSEATVLRARGGEQEQQLPLSVAREWFEPLLVRASPAERESMLAGAAALAEPLFATDPGAPLIESPFAVLHGLYWLMSNLADRRPLVMAVDDAHWIDEASQRFLAYLLPRVAELPVLVLLTLRPRELPLSSRLAAALAGSGDLEYVEPAPLTEEGTAALVEGDPDFSAAVQRVTRGNPLLVRTLLSALRSNEVDPISANAVVAESMAGAPVARILLPRLHGLGPEAVAVARAAAVLGERGTFPDVAVLARLAKDEAAAAVERLQAAEVLVADRALAFTHPLVRAAVLDELGAADTEEWQLRAARLLADRAEGSTRAAAHLLHAAPVGEPWAGELLRRAAVDASARGAPESAIAFLERAMSEPMDTPTRALTTLQLGIAGFAANDARALEWLASATRAATDSALWQPAWTATVYVSVIWKAPLPDDLRIRELPQLSDDAHLALAAMKANSFMTGVWEDAIVAPIPQPADPQSSDREAAVTWFGGAAWRGLCDGKPAVTVIELADRALALPPGGHLLDYYRHSFAAMALVFAGEPERGIRHLDDGVEFATRSGFQPEVHRYVALRACGHALIGNLREAAADLAMTGPSEEFGWVLGAPVRFGVEIDVLREQGRLADADSVAAAHPVDDAETSRDLMLAYLVLAVANLRLTQRRYDAALVEYRRLARLLDERGVPRTPVYPWRLGAARALAALGREEEALELARAQLDDARQLGAPMWIGASLRALGSVVPGPSGTELLREAVEVLAGTPFRLEYAHALCELGTRLRRGRQIVDAREPLRRSLDLAERCGADALVERATTELLATGARPRRRAVTGVDALTPAESRVARLAAAGSSNAEIAQTLFVSRKTVEKHLGNAYAKLAVTSRAELAETPGVSDRNGGVLPH